MFRRIVGFALLALAVGLALKIAFGLFGFLFGLAVTAITLAAVGYGCYLVLKVVSPSTAKAIRELIGGSPTSPSPPRHLTPKP